MKKYLGVFLFLLLLAAIGCSESNSTNTENKLDDKGNTNNPLTQEGFQYKVKGKSFSFDVCQVLIHTPVVDYLTIAAPGAVGIQLRTLPNEKGTYKNTVGDNPYRRYNVWFVHEGKRYNADNNRGNSSITFTEVGVMGEMGSVYTGQIKGYFSGTFIADDNTELVVTDGFFYTVAPRS